MNIIFVCIPLVCFITFTVETTVLVLCTAARIIAIIVYLDRYYAALIQTPTTTQTTSSVVIVKQIVFFVCYGLPPYLERVKSERDGGGSDTI